MMLGLLFFLWSTAASPVAYPPSVDKDAIAEIETLWPGMGSLVAAIRIHENGRPGHECGHMSGWVARYRSSRVARWYPANHRNYIEAGRSVGKALVAYALLGDKRPEFYWFLASRYHNGTPAGNEAWADSVRRIHKRMKKA